MGTFRYPEATNDGGASELPGDLAQLGIPAV